MSLLVYLPSHLSEQRKMITRCIPWTRSYGPFSFKLLEVTIYHREMEFSPINLKA